jgi:hypothetical protein
MLPLDVDALYDAFKHPRAERPSLPPDPGLPAGPPSYPNSKIKIHYAAPRPPRPATGQRERSGLGGQVVLIPRSSLISGRIGEPGHSQPNPWKELSQLAPAGEQIARFGGKKAVQTQQPIADQNGGSRAAPDKDESHSVVRSRIRRDIPVCANVTCAGWWVPPTPRSAFRVALRPCPRGPDGLAGMNLVIAWAGFLGAWLLVARPLYQGALELDEEDVDRKGIEASAAHIPRPDPPSPWRRLS